MRKQASINTQIQYKIHLISTTAISLQLNGGNNQFYDKEKIYQVKSYIKNKVKQILFINKPVIATRGILLSITNYTLRLKRSM